MIILDTHCWLWWLSDPDLLSQNAKQVLENAVAEDQAMVSSISVWEVAMLVSRGRLQLSMTTEEWIAEAERQPGIRFVPVTNRVAHRAVDLPGTFHPDPADRIIVATALVHGATVVTKDGKIRGYRQVQSIW
jgi:PIN domain nuclease of toxin-antitoxin system